MTSSKLPTAHTAFRSQPFGIAFDFVPAPAFTVADCLCLIAFGTEATRTGPDAYVRRTPQWCRLAEKVLQLECGGTGTDVSSLFQIADESHATSQTGPFAHAHACRVALDKFRGRVPPTGTELRKQFQLLLAILWRARHAASAMRA